MKHATYLLDGLGRFGRAAPLLYLCELVNNENPLSLTAGSRFHDPHGIRIASEFFNEKRVVCREEIRNGYELRRARDIGVFHLVFEISINFAGGSSKSELL